MGLQDRNRFDDLLEPALNRYGNAEPRTGIEGRVLANLAAHRERRRMSWRWMWAVPSLGALIVVLALWLGHSSSETAPGQAPVRDENATAALPAKRDVDVQSVSVEARHVRKTHRALKVPPETEAKLPQFPSPRPMGEQELLLREYVQHYPDEAMLMAKQQDEFQAAVEQAEQELQRSSNREER